MSEERPGARTAGARARSRRRVLGFMLGAALIAAAVWAVARQPETFRGAMEQVARAPWWQVALLAGSVAATFVLIASAFWVLTTRYGRIGKREMMALIFAAGLLNYLPLWPGMFGRLAYHQRVNKIAVVDSAKALIWANVVSILAAAALLLILSGLALMLPGDDWRLGLMVCLPVPALAVFAVYARAKRPEPDPEVWRVIAATSVRYAELLVWGVRYQVCFAMIGAPIAWGGALALGALTRLAVMAPIVPNGLGVREWSVALAAPLLPMGLVASAALTRQNSLMADLLNRAVEVAVAIPLGLVGAWWVARRLRRAG